MWYAVMLVENHSHESSRLKSIGRKIMTCEIQKSKRNMVLKWVLCSQDVSALEIVHHYTSQHDIDELEDYEYLDFDDENIENSSQEWKKSCLLYTSPSPRDRTRSRMPSSA